MLSWTSCDVASRYITCSQSHLVDPLEHRLKTLRLSLLLRAFGNWCPDCHLKSSTKIHHVEDSYIEISPFDVEKVKADHLVEGESARELGFSVEARSLSKSTVIALVLVVHVVENLREGSGSTQSSEEPIFGWMANVNVDTLHQPFL